MIDKQRMRTQLCFALFASLIRIRTI